MVICRKARILDAARHVGYALVINCVLLAAPVVLALGERGIEPATLSHVSELRWQNRLVIVLASPSPEEDVTALRTHAAQIDERDVMWFVLGANDMATNFPERVAKGFDAHLRDTFGGGPAVILVGKDGRMKMRGPRLDLGEIFSRIDGMPMRQREIRQPIDRL